ERDGVRGLRVVLSLNNRDPLTRSSPLARIDPGSRPGRALSPAGRGGGGAALTSDDPAAAAERGAAPLDVWGKAAGEERQDLVAGGDGRLAGFVDQVGGHHAVRTGDTDGEEGGDVGVCGAVREHMLDEAISESRRIGGEALRSAEPVARAAISQHRD